MAYLTQTDLEIAIGAQAVATLFDNGSGAVDTAALDLVFSRAGAWVDAYLATVYRGPWPIPSPTPVMVKEAALTMAIGLSYDRRPEFVRQVFGEARRDYRKEAKDALKMFAEGNLTIVENSPAKSDTITGGIVYASGPRLIVDSPDGTSNTGDF